MTAAKQPTLAVVGPGAPPQSSGAADDPLRDKNYRLAQIDDHPFINDKVVFNTAAIDGLYCEVRVTVMVRAMGRWVAAETGAGKSFAVRAIAQRLEQEFPRAVIITVNARNLQSASVRYFYQTLLRRTGHPEVNGETGALISRLIERLVQRVPEHGMRIVVLMIDEAHAMRNDELTFLRDLDNDLAECGIQLVPLLLGETPDLEELMRRVRGGRPKGLAARFARAQLSLPRLHSEQHVREILAQFDTLVHPTPAWPFTRFFLPFAFDGGFRLAHEASSFVSAMKQTHLISEGNGISQRAMFAALRYLLRTLAGADEPGLVIAPEHWNEACKIAAMDEAVEGIAGGALTLGGVPQ